jgi:tRNA (guanine37-N1)-methyltransferase
VLLSPRGRFRQSVAAEFAGLERLILLCGRYEGIDERSLALAGEVSLGDSSDRRRGGSVAVIEATVRLLPGAGDSGSAEADSFEGRLLD